MVVRPSPTRWNWTGTGCTHTYLKTGQREVNNTFGEIQHHSVNKVSFLNS